MGEKGVLIDQDYINDYKFIIGCDEVGRGPIAGPVVGCAVRVKCDPDLLQFFLDLGVTDSKKLSHKKRTYLLELLEIELSNLKTEYAYTTEYFDFCLWSLGPEEIDQINILQASLRCMSRAAEAIYRQGSIVLIDGNQKFRDGSCQGVPVIKGDSRSVAIGLASIIAKEFRDELMVDLNRKYPGYGLDSHAGYPTKAHKEAVRELGVSPIHRKSFKGVKEYVSEGNGV